MWEGAAAVASPSACHYTATDLTQTSANANLFVSREGCPRDWATGGGGPMCSAGKWTMPLSARAGAGNIRNTSAQSHYASEGPMPWAQGAMPVEVLRFADGDEHLHLLGHMKWVRSLCTTGRHLSDLDSGQTRLVLGGARCVQQSTLHKRRSQQTTRGSSRFFELLISALGTLNPVRPSFMLLAPMRGPVRKKVARARGAGVRERT